MVVEDSLRVVLGAPSQPSSDLGGRGVMIAFPEVELGEGEPGIVAES
jgi:hypothetical protein